MTTTQKKCLGMSLLLTTLMVSAFTRYQGKPTLFIIGDSTVKNGSGKGLGDMWGWGDRIAGYFDQDRITLENHALGGTSSRTYLTKGLWDSVLVKIKPGDFVIMQFGHNDGGALDDTARARGTIKGIGPEHREIYNPITKKQEAVYSYGWYLRKFINDTHAKGATAIVCSPIPRNIWKDGKVERNTRDYGGWAGQVAKAEQAFFIDLNLLTATKYEAAGEQVVKGYFPGDHTHTNAAGALVNAASVVEGLRSLRKCPLRKYLIEK